MKRSRHKQQRSRHKQVGSPEPVAELYPDLFADLPEEICSELPNELPTAALRAEWRVTRKRGEDE